MTYGAVSLNLLKRISLCIASYGLGYFRCSLLWIILPVLLDMAREKRAKHQLLKRDFIRNLSYNDEQTVMSSLTNLPAWVCFPDMERAEWLNKIIKQLWPNVNNYVHDIIKELLEAKLNKKIGKYGLSGLVFEKLAVGTVPFRIGGIVVFENNNASSSKEIVLDMDVTYAGDCDITLKFSKVKGSIKDFQLYGRLRIILKPLIDTLPLAGGVQLFFLNPPDIDFTLEGLAGVLEFRLLTEMLKKLILDTICSLIVLPNKYPVQLTKKVSKEDIKIPNPKGVLRIHVVQARHLMKRDLTFTGHLTSDPYAVLTIGDQEFKTPVKAHTAKPKWHFWCEFIIEEINGVYLYISLWDDDDLQEDEPLGRAKVQISKLVEKKTADMWFNLEHVKHGQIQLRTSWLTVSADHEALRHAFHEIQQLQVSTLSTSILTVFVNSAADLLMLCPPNKKQPELYVQVTVRKQEKSTRTIKKSTDPVWEEGFMFLVPNPEDDCVSFKVIDGRGDGTVVGEFIYNISTLFGENQLRIEKQTFRLSECESEGKINLSMTLRVLVNADLKTSASSSTQSDGSEGVNRADNQSDSLKDLSEHSSLSRSSSVSSSDNSDSSSIKSSDILSPAKIKLTLRYTVQRQRLIVVVHHLEDLLFDETRSFYVKLYLLPERHKDTKRRTKVIRTSKNPVFDETFEFVISQEELAGKHLEVSVCEERVIKNEPIEKVVIDLDKLGLVLPYTKLFRLSRKSHES